MPSLSKLELIWPNLDGLAGYRAALEAGWSPDNIRGAKAALEELERIACDPVAFVAAQVDRAGKGAPITLPDGSTARRLPGYRRWLWDGEFCGVISLRWQPGTADLPPHCLGHIGYAVVPWKRRRGYATAALRLILQDARAEGLPHVIITTLPENLASQKVILANGGQGLGRFPLPPGYADGEELVFRVDLATGLSQASF